jgi:hypothetical protein
MKLTQVPDSLRLDCVDRRSTELVLIHTEALVLQDLEPLLQKGVTGMHQVVGVLGTDFLHTDKDCHRHMDLGLGMDSFLVAEIPGCSLVERKARLHWDCTEDIQTFFITT